VTAPADPASGGEAARDEAARDEAAPGEAAPGEAAPGEAAPGEAAPGEAARDKAARGEAARGAVTGSMRAQAAADPAGHEADGAAPPGAEVAPTAPTAPDSDAPRTGPRPTGPGGAAARRTGGEPPAGGPIGDQGNPPVPPGTAGTPAAADGSPARNEPERFGPALVERSRRRLAAFVRRASQAEGRAAAVAIVLVATDDGAPGFLLTRRTTRLSNHAGQWALPGGRTDDGEDPPTAARRELAEELGLFLGTSEVLGCLDDYATRSGFVITPVVMAVDRALELVPNPHEVAAAYVVPVAALHRPGTPRFIRIPESDRLVIQIPLLGSLIHAPTAAVLHQFYEVVMAGRPTRVAAYEQPVWAWR
jgi:8-oxo-dGTP pyrophosphatase MutT (NUDIX family)